MSRRIGFELLEHRSLFSVLPGGFSDTTAAGGLSQPTSTLVMADGRILVTQKAGQLRVIKNGALLATPALQLSVDSQIERGLLSVVANPNFSTNHYLYAYYNGAGNDYAQVSRFTLSGDAVAAGSEKVLLRIDPQMNGAHHLAGAMHFGNDGELYIAVGDNEVDADAQSLATMHGKLLRINADGSIPADNPYISQVSGPLQSIYAIGLRNPYTFAVDSASGKIFINDVGAKAFEEIDVARAGANYGWPGTEGPTNDPAYDSPLYAYPPPMGVGTAIVGGTFYSGVTQQFPSAYKGQYFFGDYINGFIETLDPATGKATPFATDLGRITDLDVALDGTLLVTTYDGTIHAIKYTAPSPPPTPPPTPPPAASSSIRGYLFNDGNANGVFDGADTYTGTRTVYLDANRNGKLDAGETQTSSDASGNYRFANLSAGTYYVSRVFPSGYHFSNNGVGYLTVTVAAGQSVTNANIGSTHEIGPAAPPPAQPPAAPPAATASIAGYLFNDGNGDGLLDGSDTFTGVRTVFIDANRNGKLDAGEVQTTSDAEGNYAFKNLGAATYYVSRVFPAGYRLSNGKAGYLTVTLSAGQHASGVNLGTTSHA